MSTPKVVLVTGCSKGGIGFHFCEEFAQRGCIVYATARKVGSMEGMSHASVRHRAMDVTDDESVQNTVNEIIAAEGRLDILVNNAGVICIGAVIDIPTEQVKQTFDANVFGVLRTSRLAIPHMASRKQGIIVNVGSVVGEIPTPWNGIYCASKAALHSLTDVLQMECRPLGVSVVLVAPGSVRSNIANNHAKVFSQPEHSLYRNFLKQILRRMNISQDKESMPTDVFARRTVDRILSRHGPPLSIMLGGNVSQIKLLKWLPKWLVLWLVWKAFSSS